MILSWTKIHGVPFLWFRRALPLVAGFLLLVNLIAWWAAEKVFLLEARQMDLARARSQAGLVSNLLDKESVNLRRIVIARASRLKTDLADSGSTLDDIGFDSVVTEAFLIGANIDTYLVADAHGKPRFSRNFNQVTETLEPLSPQLQQEYFDLRRFAVADGGYLSGFHIRQDGSVEILAGVPVVNGQLIAWIIASRDIDEQQVERYAELVERPFRISPAKDPAANGALPAQVAVDLAALITRWQHADLAGRPMIDLEMPFDDSYQQHMAEIVFYSRTVVLLLSVFAGSMTLLLAWRWGLSMHRENESRREVERVARLAAVGELAAGVAHEVNNPNGMIQRNLGFVSDVMIEALPLLAERDDAEYLSLGGIDFAVAREQLPQLLEDMTLGSKRIGQIVSDLKDFAREDDDLGPELFDLNSAVETAVRLLRSTINKATDHFQMALDKTSPRVPGNIRHIEQVVMNLLQNACQSLPDRSRAICVSTRSDRRRQEAMVEVLDQGSGIDPQHQEYIFNPFFTTRRESGGTGLGLSVSLRIVKRHNGSLELLPGGASGTRAILCLPFVEETP